MASEGADGVQEEPEMGALSPAPNSVPWGLAFCSNHHPGIGGEGFTELETFSHAGSLKSA